jgi:uncharacterized membrane protein YagU involved in acid resistance
MAGEFAQGEEEAPEVRWWGWDSILAPSALAVGSAVLAAISLIGLSPANEISESLFYIYPGQPRVQAVGSAIHVIVAVLAAWLAFRVIRQTWEDIPGWTSILARVAVVLAAVSVVLNIAAFSVALASGPPEYSQVFRSPPVQLQSPLPLPSGVIVIPTVSP